MIVTEILDRLDRGEVVTIRASDAFEFMRETERHSLTPQSIKMVFVEDTCVMQRAKPENPNDH